MNSAQQKAVNAAIRKNLETIRQYALTLRHVTCTYTHPDPFNSLNAGTINLKDIGKGKVFRAPHEWRCDCKFLPKQGDVRRGSESCGCCEAASIRQLVDEIEGLLGE